MTLCKWLLPLIFSGCCLLAGEEPFSVDDPRGDDFGAGAISYPSGADFEPGDLDLLNFSAEHDGKGTWFSARFANKVRTPDTRTSKLSPVPLKDVARYGFFNLNVDVYIDTDGYEGSGRTDTLPGRKIRIADSTAWDKAVFLTPRPHMAESWMVKLLAEELGDDKASKATAKAEIEKYYYFSDRIRVRGKTIRWYVPDEFLGGPASADWRYVVVVTGADPEQKMDLSFFKQKHSGLVMMPMGSGRPFEAFQLDYDADPNQPPIIDALLPTEQMQRDLLGAFNKEDGYRAILGGLRPSGRTAPPKPLPKPVALKNTVPQAESGMKAITRAKPAAHDHDHAHDDAQHPAPAAPPAHAPPPAAVPAEPSVAPPAPAPAKNQSIADRLRQLDGLLKQGLVSEEEYKQLRAKILNDL